MTTLKEAAQAYEPPQTKNISDLPEVHTNFVLANGEGKNKSGETFSYRYILVGNEEYRVPGKVIGDLKAILEHNPNLQKFKVIKKGAGLDTKYTVIPL